MEKTEPSSLLETTTQRQEEENSNGHITIPVIEEQVRIGKKLQETARVKISKTVMEDVETIDVSLLQEEIVVERISKNEFVSELLAPVRYEGDVMIIPIVKEVLVVEKKLLLVEEVRILKKQFQKNEKQEVVVRKEQISIERKEIDNTNG